MYSLIPNLEAVKLMKEKDGKMIENIHKHFAKTYKLNDGKFIIIPDIGKYSLLFDNEKEIKEFLNNPEYPLISDDPFTNESENLFNLPKSIDHFYHQFNLLFDVQLSKVDNHKSLESFFEILERKQNLKKNEYMIASIILGDYLCTKINFHWERQKNNFQFQEYCVPQIVHKSGINFYPFWQIFEDYSPKQSSIKYFDKLLSRFLETVRLNKSGED